MLQWSLASELANSEVKEFPSSSLPIRLGLKGILALVGFSTSPRSLCLLFFRPRLCDESNDSLVRFDHLHLFRFSLLLPLVPCGTLVRGYPVHGNVKRHGVPPPSPGASGGVFIFDAGAIEGKMGRESGLQRRGGEMPEGGERYECRAGERECVRYFAFGRGVG